jgi:hypothetical protein
MRTNLEDLRKAGSKSLALMQAAVAEEVLAERFSINTRNEKKLRRSLAASDLLELAECTLLTLEIHKKHAQALETRLVNQARRLLPATAKSIDGAQDRFRFVTLLDSLQLVDTSKILVACDQMRQDIHAAVADTTGIWMLGVIEVEIVNMHLMRKIRDKGNSAESEMRKLEVLEAMCKTSQLKDASSLALVHFHGVASSTQDINFDALRSKFNKLHRWRRAARQVEIKKLSNQFAGKKKSLASNLGYISSYITKGGNDWAAGKAYLRYKIGFNNEDAVDEGTWYIKNYRRNQDLMQEVIEVGVEDVLSMTGYEIATQAQVIDALMSRNRTRTGYLIHARSGDHSRKLSQL